MGEKVRAAEVQGMLGAMRSAEKNRTKNAISDIVNRLNSIGGIDILSEAAGIKPGQRGVVNEIADGIMDGAATRLAQDTFTNPGSAAARYVEAMPSARSQMRPVTRGEWRVKPFTSIGRSGKEQIRYQVSSDRAILPDSWRHKIVAETVAAALEQTGGNLSDKRIDRIRELCAEEDAILVEINNQKRLIESVPAGNQKRRGAHDVRLEEARKRLRAVRRSLGVA